MQSLQPGKFDNVNTAVFQDGYVLFPEFKVIEEGGAEIVLKIYDENNEKGDQTGTPIKGHVK